MTDAEHLQDGARLLCRRKKNVDVFILPGGKKFRVVAEMKDEVHHMRINMIVNQPSLRIKAIDCEMPGVPDDICLETRSFFQPLIGKRIIGGLMQDMKSLTHKACTHLVNLFHEACYNITLAQSVLGEEQLTELFPGLTQEQLFTFYLWFKPELRNSCIRYADNSAFMQKLKEVEMPQGANKVRAIATAKS